MRKERRPHQPLFIRDLEVERVSSFKYLGVHISDDLTWTLNTTYVLKRAQQRLYFLRRLRKFGMSPRILSNFYSCIIESILTSCITVWYGSTTVKDRKRLQRVVKTATKITKMAQPSLQSIYNLRVHRRAASIIKDPTHPQHGLFTLLPSAGQVQEMEIRIKANEDNLTDAQTHIGQMEKEIAFLKEKTDDLENRNRRSNVKIVNIPEKAEGNDAVGYVERDSSRDFLERDTSQPRSIERAHCLGKAVERIKPILMKFLNYSDEDAPLGQKQGDCLFGYQQSLHLPRLQH
ncbi:hypothetical protein NFI96_004844 [Prochilodus magdalenae]|nr:hypothetical protein NFI96_004844 [Prochilodus magdalenae]